MDENKRKAGMDMTERLKRHLKTLSYYTGVSSLIISFSGAVRAKWLILTYHRIAPGGERDCYLSVPAETFEEHMRFISRNFVPISMERGLDVISGKANREIYVTVNFDDGYMDNYTYAYPVLKKYNVPSVIYLTTGYIGKKAAFWWDRVFKIVSSSKKKKVSVYSAELGLADIRQKEAAVDYINSFLKRQPAQDQEIERLKRVFDVRPDAEPVDMLGWEEIRELGAGPVEIGAHTETHRNLCLMEEGEARKEILNSKKTIEKKTGLPVKYFSYPFGYFNAEVRSMVEDSGFICARSNTKGLNTSKNDRFSLSCVGAGSVYDLKNLMARIAVNCLKF